MGGGGRTVPSSAKVRSPSGTSAGLLSSLKSCRGHTQRPRPVEVSAALARAEKLLTHAYELAGVVPRTALVLTGSGGGGHADLGDLPVYGCCVHGQLVLMFRRLGNLVAQRGHLLIKRDSARAQLRDKHISVRSASMAMLRQMHGVHAVRGGAT